MTNSSRAALMVHAAITVLLIISVTVLAVLRIVQSDTVNIIFGTALGSSGIGSGLAVRNNQTHREDMP